MKHIFIINPSAGKKRSTAALVDSIQALDLPCEIAFTEKTGIFLSLSLSLSFFLSFFLSFVGWYYNIY